MRYSLMLVVIMVHHIVVPLIIDWYWVTVVIFVACFTKMHLYLMRCISIECCSCHLDQPSGIWDLSYFIRHWKLKCFYKGEIVRNLWVVEYLILIISLPPWYSLRRYLVWFHICPPKPCGMEVFYFFVKLMRLPCHLLEVDMIEHTK